MIMKIRDEEAAQRPTSFLGFWVFRSRGRRRVRRVEKWKTWVWFSTFPSGARRGCGNVEISRGGRDFQGPVGSVGNRFLVFHTFHGPGISTAPLRLHRKRGGIGDSLLQRRKSWAFAVFILSAHSVSLIARAHASIRLKVIPGLRY